MAHILRLDDGLRLDEGWRLDQWVPDQIWKGSGKMSDLIPRARGAYRAWLLNIKTQITTIGPTLGLSSGATTGVQATCQAQIDLIDELAGAETELDAAQQAQEMGRRTTDQTLRQLIGDWKRLPAWTPEIAAQLHAVGSPTGFDPDAYKPEFKVSIVAGEIRLDWKKKGVDGVAIYARLAGQGQWTRIGVDTSSPYIDGRPLAQAGVPESREYMLRGMLRDDEIGLDSDILRVTWTGQ